MRPGLKVWRKTRRRTSSIDLGRCAPVCYACLVCCKKENPSPQLTVLVHNDNIKGRIYACYIVRSEEIDRQGGKQPSLRAASSLRPYSGNAI